jgi:putative membrane protein
VSPRPRQTTIFDLGLQHERTALAWERTAIATMVSGVLLARYAAESAHVLLAIIGLLQTASGGALLLWASLHYDARGHHLRDSTAVAQPTIARLIGLSTVAFIAASLVLAVILTAAG